MEFERIITQNGKSLQITIPLDLAKYLNLDKGSEIIIRDEQGKYGPYASFWKKTTANEERDNNEQLFE